LSLWVKTRKLIVSALSDYQMIADKDRVMVAVSGGKDSSILLMMLSEIAKRAEISFTVHPVILDQKQPGFDLGAFREWVEGGLGHTLSVINEDTYSIVKQAVSNGKSYCGLCSRLRRGILYNYAADHGYDKIALGHHRDDLNETLMLNLMFNGRISSMPPKLFSDDGRNTVIRPLCYVPESSLMSLSESIAMPIIPCNLCGSQENLQRARIKAMLDTWQKEFPHLGASMLKAQQNVRPSQLLDKKLWSFQSSTTLVRQDIEKPGLEKTCARVDIQLD